MFKGLYTEFISHYTMIQDCHRTLGFYNAIKSKISAGDIVVDLGSGSGVLAVLCAKLGASKVFAVEQNKNLCATIKSLAEANGVSDKIEIHSTTSDIFLENFNGKVDLLVSEGIGDHIFESRLIYDFLLFKEKFSVKKTVPEHFGLYCYPEYVKLDMTGFLKIQENTGINLDPIKDLPLPDLESSYFDIQRNDLYFQRPKSKKQSIELFKFSNKEELIRYVHNGILKANIVMNTAPCSDDYIMLFFKIKLSDNIILTNSPKRKKSSHSYYQRLISTKGIIQNTFTLWINYKMHEVNKENIPYPNLGLENV